MNPLSPMRWIAFARRKKIASGSPTEVAELVMKFVEADKLATVAIFDAHTSHTIEIDLHGSLAAVHKRLPAPAAATPSHTDTTPKVRRGPGRPKLGVVAREVTLLPRHWEWLATQTGGASVALRKLVEQAQKTNAEPDRRRAATDAAYRFMFALAGDEAGFEEASRALFSGDLARLQREVAPWPHDIRQHLLELANAAFTPPAPAARSETAG